ncbi:MAG: hypothetical protein PHE78_04075 [Candidatus Gastranaerophilales bacterium]|jgi:hypothetical protein|nr:hypothetical protein [Candidatus Gastranaerophilales bacterium]
MQITQQNSPNFKGSFQGLWKNGDQIRKAPLKEVWGCPYADRMMLNTIVKIAKSKDLNPKLEIVFQNSEEGKSILFNTSPEAIKKSLPLITRITQGIFDDLQNPTFWKLLANKKTEAISYRLKQEDLPKLISYFFYPRTPSEVLENKREDTNILKKIAKFEKTMKEKFSKQEDQKWLNEFFSTSNI